MSTQYYCRQARRRALVLGQAKPALNGIDYLEVADGDQTTLLVHFLFPLPGQPKAVPDPSVLGKLFRTNVIIQGGVRVTGISVANVTAAGTLLTVNVNSATPNIVGDSSTYTLRLVASAADLSAPAGFDPQLASVDFSFKVECPGNFDCQQANTCPPLTYPTAPIDYLAKDYASFRQLMLDRLALTMPDWQERHSADVGVALVELLAYAGDQLSYYQDAVATEAYLGTACQRVSVRRHARLLDYFLHDGCNARAWVALQCSAPVAVPQQTLLLTQTGAAPGLLSAVSAAVTDTKVAAALTGGARAFQTMFALTVTPELNELDFYTWSDEQCCLPLGATAATLVDNGAGAILAAALKPNSPTAGVVYLLFEEVLGPATGAAADADPTHRQVVRLTQATPGTDPLDNTKIVDIAWDASDALTFPLCLSIVDRETASTSVSVARGNLILADHGMNRPAEELAPLSTAHPFYRPRLQNLGLTFGTAYDPAQASGQPAAALLVQDPRAALPLIALAGDGNAWTPLRDLLSSTRTATNFVVEMENDGTAQLRFGDGVLGHVAVDGLSAAYRTGNGSAGNVGAEAIVNIVGTLAVPLTGIQGVRNPLPAQGGVDGETLDEVRANAPWAFRKQERAVTTADYAAVAERHPEVKRAQATLRWTGSWYTMFVTVERIRGGLVDDAFRALIRTFLEQFRLAGYDLEIEAPIFVPLDVAFTVCVAPGYFPSAVEAALLQTFSNGVLPNGQLGFFNPDNFTFGQPVYLSHVVAAAMQVPGVRWVDTNDVPVNSPNHFKRWGQPARGETAAGKIVMARLEIARLDNNASEPENGKIAFIMEGSQ
jgi:hypothetical protein